MTRNKKKRKGCAKVEETGSFLTTEPYKMETTLEEEEITFQIHKAWQTA
jgi:hypothetical protein